MSRLLMTVSVAALLFTLAAGGASAQNAVNATPFAGRETPDSSLCTVAARSSAILTPAANATVTASGNPVTPEAVSEPTGQAVSAETEAEITIATRELYACLNNGDPLRTLALFTDRAAAQFLAARPDLALSGTSATPTPLDAGSRIALVALTDFRLLPDGRVFVLATQDDPNRPPDGPEPVFLTFAKQGDRWLIDDIQFLASGA